MRLRIHPGRGDIGVEPQIGFDVECVWEGPRGGETPPVLIAAAEVLQTDWLDRSLGVAQLDHMGAKLPHPTGAFITAAA